MNTRTLGTLLGIIVGGALFGLLTAQTRISPDQLKAPRVAVMTCTKAPTATADCTGLYFVDVVTPAGTELKIVGTVQPDVVNAADWSLVP